MGGVKQPQPYKLFANSEAMKRAMEKLFPGSDVVLVRKLPNG